MHIVKIDIYKMNVAFKNPVKVSIGITTAAKNVVVKITSNTGLVGWGEASPSPYITGDCQDSNFVTAQHFARLIKGKDPLAIDSIMRTINEFTVGQPSIRSAFDMALYDIAAKSADMPLFKFLGGERRELRTDLTIGLQDTVAETVKMAEDILAAGFEAIKLKVGRDGLQDLPHVQAVRELAGPKVAIKIDSNQGWDYPTAVANIQAMAFLNLQYSEQPLAVWDIENMARLRDKVELPICADESVFDDTDALRLARLGAADYFNIKLGKSGGIHTAKKINVIAEAAGCKCMIGCFGESRLALGAAAHLAMAVPNIVFLDLDSAYYFKEDPVVGGMHYSDVIGGLIHIPENVSGHGGAFDESYLAQWEHVCV